DWTIIDKIFDTYVERGMKPLVEIGFMPEALSSQPNPYRHNWEPGNPYGNIYTGWAHPPKDYEKWAELVFQWVKHSVERYGKEEVETWYWELWNEPNIGYWQGSTEEYIKLYDYTTDAVKRALPTAIMGGPHSTGPGWDKAAAFLKTFLEHCLRGKNHVTGKTGTPLDFIAFHAKGNPKFIEDHVQMNMGAQLNDISKGFEIVASFPELKNTPIIIGESDPEGCAACSMDIYAHNGYRNGTMYSSYTAASFPRKMALADHFGVNFLGAVTWAFEFEDQPWFHGFRDLATNGVDKPVLNVFRMFGMMEGDRVKVSGDLVYDCFAIRDSSVRGEKNDINALATVNEKGAEVMVWNYHDDDLAGPAVPVSLDISGLTNGRVLVHHYRVDKNHSNA
ncbi:MAG: beta-xylosidase, partial [Bacteroidetes bacterium]|nr:beta-xylosidase [Bacteroidota bacterium]